MQPIVTVTDEQEYVPIRFDSIPDISDRATAMLSAVRERMISPHPRKAAPIYSLAQIASMCKMEKSQASYILANKSDTVPTGTVSGKNRKREFSLVEAQQWISQFGNFGTRPDGARAFTIAVGNFKGGVNKTTTTMALAQGLSLRGRKVLLIDLDPQASLTALNGILADSEVNEEQTILPYIYESQNSLEYAVQPTYWNGIDLIPASASLFSAEFYLPSKQSKNPKFEFWNVLNTGLESLRSKYDVIIFDTPPALSYLTTNAFFAADGLIVPMPPSALDFASSTQFWSLFSDLTSSILKSVPSLKDKAYQFINILITMSEQSASAGIVQNWIRKTYGLHVLNMEIPKTTVAQAAAASFGTAYDISSYSGSNATYMRVRDAYDQLAERIDTQVMAAWNRK